VDLDIEVRVMEDFLYVQPPCLLTTSVKPVQSITQAVKPLLHFLMLEPFCPFRDIITVTPPS
jgi:hypothetical protein